MLSQIEGAQKADRKNKNGEVATSSFKMALLRSKDVEKSIKDDVSKMLRDEAFYADAAERGVFTYDAEGETVATA